MILRVEQAEGFEHFNTLSPIHSMNELETELKDAYILELCDTYEAIMREGRGLSEQEEWENALKKGIHIISDMKTALDFNIIPRNSNCSRSVRS